MSRDITPMKWKRSDSIEYPKVWHRFKARDSDSDMVVEYRIEDLLETRKDEVFKHMKENYMVDEPLSQALGGDKDPDHFEDFAYAWNLMFAQKTPVICYKEGSDEIVGVNVNFVTHKDDHFVEKFLAISKSPVTKTILGIASIPYTNFSPFNYYGVDEYLTCFALSVDRKYRGRHIGDHFMAARKTICKEFALKLTHSTFSSDYSRRNAENAGFKTDASISYVEVMKIRPEYNLSNVKSAGIYAKSLVFEY